MLLLLRLQNKQIIFFLNLFIYVGVITNFCVSPFRPLCLLLTFCLKRATAGSQYLYVNKNKHLEIFQSI